MDQKTPATKICRFKKGRTMKQEFIDLYDEYTHSDMSRRSFLEKLTLLAGSAAAASTVLSLLDLNQALAVTVAEDDKRIVTSRGIFGEAKKNYKGYFASPRDNKIKLGAVVVIHENRGLNAHIEDVARRLAVAGFRVLAPDGLSSMGGTPPDAEKAKELIGQLKPEEARALFLDATSHMRREAGKVGCVGFCWGGAMAGELAVSDAKLNAAVVYYGRQPKVDDVSKIKAPLLLHYAGKDARVNEGIPAFESALKKNKVKYQLHMYPEAQHAFNNDTAGERYNKEAATLAWERTLTFFKEHLA